MSVYERIDQMTRRTAMALGIVAIALGVATLVAVEPFVQIIPSSYLWPVLAGALAAIFGLWMARARYRSEASQTTIPSVERRIATPPPGQDIDEALYRLTEYRQGTVEYREQIQERLASVATDVIRQRDDCSRAEAVHKLKEGTWTDNPHAKAFFAGGSPPSRSTVEKLSDRVFGEDETDYERWVRITIDAVVERADISETDHAETEEEEEDGLLAGLRADAGRSQSQALSSSGYRDPSDREDSELRAEGVWYHRLLKTQQWSGATAFGLVAAGWGMITYNPAVLLISVVPIAFVALSKGATDPQLTNLKIQRTLEDDTPQPGDMVQVTVTVKNEGDGFMPDLRLADRVPGSMEVVDGSARLATALNAGATASFTYTVRAERGVHEWPVIAVGRDFSGSVEREATIEVEKTMECVPALVSLTDSPVRSQTSLYTGQVDTALGGSGLEFHSVREYREGDPMKRIDWNRKARTGELATIDYQLEQAANVVLLFDARESAYVSPTPGERHAVDQGVDAGMDMFASLFDRSDLVGIAAFDTVPCWLGPGAGDEHAERARQLFATHPAIASTPPKLKEVEAQYVDPMTHVRRQLSPESQIMLFSPLCDDYTAEVARRLDSVGHPVTVISPNPTDDETPGQKLAKVERDMRVTNLREHGLHVLDWDPAEQLAIEVDRAKQRWNA